MKSLLALIFMQKYSKRSKSFKRNFKKKQAPSITIAKNLSLIVYIVFKFIFDLAFARKKSICQVAVAVANPMNRNIISLDEYNKKMNEKVANELNAVLK